MTSKKRKQRQNSKYQARIVNGQKIIEIFDEKDSFKEKSDFGTKEFRKRNIVGYEFVDPSNPKNKTKRAVNKTQTGLDWLYMRGFINVDQHKAGSLLHEQFEKAKILSIKAIDFEKLRVDGGNGEMNYTDSQIYYRKKLKEAYRYLGRDLASVVFNICCWSTTISDIENMKKWRSGTGREVLKIGLNHLAKFYGIVR